MVDGGRFAGGATLLDQARLDITFSPARTIDWIGGIAASGFTCARIARLRKGGAVAWGKLLFNRGH